MLLSRQASLRLVAFVAITSVFALAWRHFNQIPLLVIGQPSNTGLLQREKERPFFNQLQAATGLPLRVTYKALEQIGLKDTHQLQMLRDGGFDLVSLRFIQNSADEPSLAGVDLPGIIRDYAMARDVVTAYSGVIDRYLRKRYKAKLLGMWTFGSQQIFCRKPISRLADLRGLKVRVASWQLSLFVSELGGIPAVIPFDQTRDALAIGLVDCAITSAASANYAGWLAHVNYTFPIAVHFGLNGYAISQAKWNSLSPTQQRVLMQAFDGYIAELWRYSEALQEDSNSCNSGGPCRRGQPYRLTLVKPSESDIVWLRDLSLRRALPAWGRSCDRIHPDCMQEWRQTIGRLLLSRPPRRERP